MIFQYTQGTPIRQKHHLKDTIVEEKKELIFAQIFPSKGLIVMNESIT